MTLPPRLKEWIRVKIWRMWHDAPTTPRIEVSDDDIDRMEAERAKRQPT